MEFRSTVLIGVFLMVSTLSNHEVNARANFTTTEPYHGQSWTDISAPRGLLLDEAGDILVIAKGTNNIIAVYETTWAGSITLWKVVIINAAGLRLTHGITYLNGYLYASSITHVYRWPYTPGQRRLVTSPPEILIYGIPGNGHDTRTLIPDPQSRLYVSVGSHLNIDPNSNRARIRRFDLSGPVPAEGFDFSGGEVFADGLRNEVGLDFDLNGVLWGVENGADNLNRTDIGGDIHNGNPAEELNRFDGPLGTHYGYPYCFSTYELEGYPAGSQFAWPSFMNDGVHTDDWCRSSANNRPPTFSMPPHQAPLGIEFFKGEGCDSVPGSFPCSLRGSPVVAFHGSWNSDIPTGYRVTLYHMDEASNSPNGEVDIIFQTNTGESCRGGAANNCLRPVNAIFTKDGHLIISSDSTNELLRVFYGTPPPSVRQGSA